MQEHWGFPALYYTALLWFIHHTTALLQESASCDCTFCNDDDDACSSENEFSCKVSEYLEGR